MTTIIVGNNQVVSRADNHISTATHTLSRRTYIIIKYKTIIYAAVKSVHIQSTTTITVIMVIAVVCYHHILQSNATEHTHASTTVTIGIISIDISMTHGKAVPNSPFVFLIIGIVYHT